LFSNFVAAQFRPCSEDVPCFNARSLAFESRDPFRQRVAERHAQFDIPAPASIVAKNNVASGREVGVAQGYVGDERLVCW